MRVAQAIGEREARNENATPATIRAGPANAAAITGAAPATREGPSPGAQALSRSWRPCAEACGLGSRPRRGSGRVVRFAVVRLPHTPETR